MTVRSNKSLQATRDGGLSSASRLTSFGPACLSSARSLWGLLWAFGVEQVGSDRWLSADFERLDLSCRLCDELGPLLPGCLRHFFASGVAASGCGGSSEVFPRSSPFWQ